MRSIRKRAAAVVTMGVAIMMLAMLAAGPALAANKPTYPTPYPWSKVAGGTTGDYFADNYTGVSAGSVFENATTDRLLDILNSNGTYYIVFSGPEHAAGQKALQVINAQAKAAGITKIYHFDPYLDGYQLDSTDVSGIGSLIGGPSVNTTGNATVSEAWRLIAQSLPASASLPGGVLYGYKGDTTLLLSVRITDRMDPVNGKAILSSWQLANDDASSFDPAAAASKNAVKAVYYPAPGFTLVPASVRSEYEFFKRVYNGSATYIETRSGATQDRVGSPVQVFSDVDFPNGQGFVLNSVDIKEYYNLVNSPGEKVFLFAGNGCHNTQAIIGSVAKQAKLLGTPVVYVVDFSLSSNVKWDAGANIDTVLNSTATGGLWIRRSAVASSTLSYPLYGYSYLYAEAAKYLDPGFVTENNSKQNNSIAFYPNAAFSGAVTTATPWATDTVAGQAVNAKRLQVPFLIRYDKDAAEPVIKRWLHKNSANDGTYTEYMLELAWVRKTQAAVESTATYVDGLTRTQFASEAVAALDPVLVPKSVALSNASTVKSLVYTGAALKPVVSVVFDGKTLVAGRDYTLSYKNNTQVGTAKVTVTGTGAYIGTKSISFSINPKPTSIRSISVGAGKLAVSWAKVSGTTRYELAYRVKGSTAWKTLSVSGSATSATIRNLKKGKTYQLHIRDYRTVSSVRNYSTWSATKTSGRVN